MPTVNDELLRAAIGHSVDLEHFNNGVIRKLIALLNKVDADLFRQLTAALERMPADSFTVARLDALLGDVRTLNTAAYNSVEKQLGIDLRDLVDYESGYQYQLFQNTLPVQVSIASVTPESVYAAAMARPFQVSKDGAVPMAEYLQGLSADRAAKIRDAVRLGFVEGEPIDAIVRRIRGTKTQNYADGLMEGPRHYLEGMVRTAVNHTANFTRQRFYEANTGILKGWMFVATLDARTSITCASLSGKVFPIGEGPQPPRHINCRSTSCPVTRGWKELGIDMPEFSSTRASMDGQVPDSLSFSDWLRSKPAGTQDQILGATRGKLFRDNGMEVDRFTNNKGRVYTLDQLRQKDAGIFKRAGL